VKFYNDQKGFGFIQPDHGDKDVFVHVTALERAGISGLREGQRLSTIREAILAMVRSRSVPSNSPDRTSRTTALAAKVSAAEDLRFAIEEMALPRSPTHILRSMRRVLDC
jgi:cold shock CspA family protein